MDLERRFDKGEIKGKAVKTDEGYIRAEAVVTRTGVFLYKNHDGTTRRELRHPDDVFEKASLDSLKMIPVTDGHPTEVVTAENAKELSIGTTGETVYPDGQHVLTTLAITTKDGAESVALGNKELSLGYELGLEKVEGVYNGERYDYRQRNIRYNHLAIVGRARAGGAAALNLDAGDAMQVDSEPNQNQNPDKETKRMLKKVTLDGIEYDAAPEVANALSKANARADKAEAKLTETQTALDEQKTANSTLEAERDQLKEDAAKNDDGEALQAAVKERLDIERIANKVLNADEKAKIGEMANIDLRKAVVMAKCPSANLDGKDDAYVIARFDGVVEMLDNDKTPADQKRAMQEKRGDSQPNDDGEKARTDAFDAIKNAHKQKEA